MTLTPYVCRLCHTSRFAVSGGTRLSGGWVLLDRFWFIAFLGLNRLINFADKNLDCVRLASLKVSCYIGKHQLFLSANSHCEIFSR
jgi:hypothetical protein